MMSRYWREMVVIAVAMITFTSLGAGMMYYIKYYEPWWGFVAGGLTGVGMYALIEWAFRGK
jgi:hypothetical protein